MNRIGFSRSRPAKNSTPLVENHLMRNSPTQCLFSHTEAFNLGVRKIFAATAGVVAIVAQDEADAGAEPPSEALSVASISSRFFASIEKRPPVVRSSSYVPSSTTVPRIEPWTCCLCPCSLST